jgi:hypothetical protein
MHKQRIPGSRTALLALLAELGFPRRSGTVLIAYL